MIGLKRYVAHTYSVDMSEGAGGGAGRAQELARTLESVTILLAETRRMVGNIEVSGDGAAVRSVSTQGWRQSSGRQRGRRFKFGDIIRRRFSSEEAFS